MITWAGLLALAAWAIVGAVLSGPSPLLLAAGLLLARTRRGARQSRGSMIVIPAAEAAAASRSS